MQATTRPRPTHGPSGFSALVDRSGQRLLRKRCVQLCEVTLAKAEAMVAEILNAVAEHSAAGALLAPSLHTPS